MKTTDYNSTENQAIKGKFVEREVLACFSYEMEAILRTSAEGKSSKDYPLPSYEDIENIFNNTCPNCGEVLPEEAFHKGERKCPFCLKGFDVADSEAKEIFEWWIVTEYLYEKLKAKGEAVLSWGNNYYWGRCTSGQAILLDHVISVICSEMEILDGQKYSWKQ